jgi:hypothetical protein
MEESYLIIVSVLLGLLGVPFVTWVKGKLNVSDGKALLIAGAVAAALGAGQLLAAGQLGLADFSLDNLAVTFGLIYASANIFFQVLKYGKGA